MTVLNLARMEADTTHIIVSGPQGPYEKVEKFPVADIRSDKVFLAYQVNGERLPQKHGFSPAHRCRRLLRRRLGQICV